ncbi:MAG: Sulfotransferase domain protein [Candidatus Scalindua rubra]|uniref:Sulfotransferase domain protein n=1 Tax=Candidatus Scalindua rubra TaxID=1872076 RepID=A0A1E3XC68_9BACT|nr:MAG: Sulfotransferase domain protein [Candidatus Scalindua rubra]
MKKGPIFITGLGRSGTTLLGNIIDRHPNIAIFVESFFIPRYYFLQVFFWPLSKPQNFIRLSKSIINDYASKENNLQMDSEMLLRVKKRNYSSLINTLMEKWAKNQGKRRWGDKSPGYISKLPLLHKLFPNAKFIHIIRDGRDVWLSQKRLGVKRSIVNFAREWVYTICKAKKYAAMHLKENYHELRYEDLIQDPKK